MGDKEKEENLKGEGNQEYKTFLYIIYISAKEKINKPPQILGITVFFMAVEDT